MFEPVPFEEIAEMELVPQAIFDRPVSHFAKKLQVTFTHQQDDFDDCEAVALRLPSGIVVALKHYRGYPAGTTTLYLPIAIRSVDDISRTIEMVIKELNIGRDRIAWQRSDDPHL